MEIIITIISYLTLFSLGYLLGYVINRVNKINKLEKELDRITKEFYSNGKSL